MTSEKQPIRSQAVIVLSHLANGTLSIRTHESADEAGNKAGKFAEHLCLLAKEIWDRREEIQNATLPRDPLAELEAWECGHKSRIVELSHDNVYGANCGWEVKLKGAKGEIMAVESAHPCNANARFVIVGTEENDWPGLSATILAALDRAKELGL